MAVIKENFEDSIEIYYRETFGSLEMKNHFHNSYEIIYITDGKARFTINGKVYDVHKGSLIFISNLENHELEVLEHPYKRYFVLVKPEYFQTIIQQPVLASVFKQRPEHFEHSVSVERMDEIELEETLSIMYREYMKKSSFWQDILSSRLQLLFIALYREHRELFPLSVLNRSTTMVLEIQKYIDQHVTESLSLSETAKLFFTDMYYLSHQFKKVTGYNFKDYIILQRISKAKDLLFYTSDDVTTVGLNAGFNNVNHFIRIFKKHEGITPYQYRKLYSREK